MSSMLNLLRAVPASQSLVTGPLSTAYHGPSPVGNLIQQEGEKADFARRNQITLQNRGKQQFQNSQQQFSQSFAETGAANARKQQAFDILKELLGGDSLSIDTEGILERLGFGSSGGVTGSQQGKSDQLIAQLQDLAQGPSGGQQTALREQGLRGIDQQFQTASNDTRSLNTRSTPAVTAAAQSADLIRDRLRARGDLERNLITDDLNRRQSTLGLLGQNIQSNISSRLQEQQTGLQGFQTVSAAEQFNSNLRLKLANLLGQG